MLRQWLFIMVELLSMAQMTNNDHCPVRCGYTFDDNGQKKSDMYYVDKKISIPAKWVGKNYKSISLKTEGISCPSEHPSCIISLENYFILVKKIYGGGIATNFGGFKELYDSILLT